MNYLKLTQDELWEQLRITDQKIKAYPPSLGGGEFLHQERDEIIKTFVDAWGYNPDNLCTTTDRLKDSEITKAFQLLERNRLKKKLIDLD